MIEDENEPMEVQENSDDSTSSEDSEEEENLKRAEELERQISDNKYLYDVHIELVDLYQKLGDLKSMREAYQRFHEVFPLTPKLWLRWIKDEIKLASNPSEQQEIFKLFDEAVEDYLSVDLWTEYAQFSIGASDLGTTRSILERGLTAAGLHVTEGSLLWDTLRELEYAHLSLTTEGSEEWKQQVNRLAEVFRRQLSIPLNGMENTYNEWEKWHTSLLEGTVDTKPVEWGYKKALKLLETYKPYEEKLLIAEADEELYEIYSEYVKVLKDPSAIVCLYERAAVQLCLVPNLWYDYIMYSFKLGAPALKVCNRALRNCPWNEELWVAKLRVLENLKREDSDVMSCFEKGISSIAPSLGLELWTGYLEYVYRTSNTTEKLDKLFVQASQQFGHESDPSSKLSRWQARVLAKKGDMIAARKIWNGVIQSYNKGNATAWLEFANLEKQYGEPNYLRTIFDRALKACGDWSQFIAEEWLMYERQFGNLEDMIKCVEKCKQVIKHQVQAVEQTKSNDKGRKRRLDHNDALGRKRRNEEFSKREDSRTKTNRKRTNMSPPEKPDVPVRRAPVERDPLKTVFISNIRPNVTEGTLKELFPNAINVEIVLDRAGKSKCFGYVQFSLEEEAMTALARDREPLDGRPIYISPCKSDKTERKPVFKYAATQETNKLFIRGLPVSKNQKDVETIFKPYGAVNVRLVMHKSGQSKGLAYVEFESEEAAQNAMKDTGQMEIDGHTITVAISAPPPKSTAKHPPPSARSEPLNHPKSKLQVPMIPRSLQVKNDSKPSSSGSNVTPKSNDDFRKMLLKK